MYSFWNKHKYALIIGGTAIAKTLLDNYWVFTNLPLAQQDHSDTASKVFYILGQIVMTGAMYGGIGHGIDDLTHKMDNSARLDHYGSLTMTRV